MANTSLAAQAVLHAVFVDEDGFTTKTTSRQVAEVFGKRHDDVLKAIRNLGCSKGFNLRNFAEIEYLDGKGRTQQMVEMTFDGFSILAMGFTGAKAMEFKEAYIAEFSRMRADLVQARDKRISMLEKYARLPLVPLTDETRQRVRELLAERMPIADVARICRCSQATVRLLRDGSESTTGDLFAQEG